MPDSKAVVQPWTHCRAGRQCKTQGLAPREGAQQTSPDLPPLKPQRVSSIGHASYAEVRHAARCAPSRIRIPSLLNATPCPLRSPLRSFQAPSAGSGGSGVGGSHTQQRSSANADGRRRPMLPAPALQRLFGARAVNFVVVCVTSACPVCRGPSRQHSRREGKCWGGSGWRGTLTASSEGSAGRLAGHAFPSTDPPSAAASELEQPAAAGSALRETPQIARV